MMLLVGVDATQPLGPLRNWIDKRPNRFHVQRLGTFAGSRQLFGVLANADDQRAALRAIRDRLALRPEVLWTGTPKQLKTSYPAAYATVFERDRSPAVWAGSDPEEVALASIDDDDA